MKPSDVDKEREAHVRRCEFARKRLDSLLYKKQEDAAYGEFTFTLTWRNGVLIHVDMVDHVMYK